MNFSELLAAILRPLEGGILTAAILAGLIFGYGYNRRLRLPPRMIYHKFIAAAVFLLFVAVIRWTVTGTLSPAGYIGVTFLWGIYCIFIYLGSQISFKGIKCFFGRVRKSTKSSNRN